MTSDLAQWVRRFPGRRILIVGDLILDRYLYGDAERISPEAPVPVLRTTERREAPGGSANVAMCAAALGCRVTCCGLVGRDRHGETLLRLLRETGIDASGVVSASDRPTTAKTRLIGLAQHRHRQQLLRVDEEERRPMEPREAEDMRRRACAAVADCDAVCIEDYDKGLITRELVEAIATEARKRRKPVLVDPARITDYARYAGVTLLTPNRAELSLAAGAEVLSLEELARAAEAMLVPLDVAAIVVTVDRDGALLAQRDQPWKHLTTVPRSVYDNTGAGDAVLAMLAAAVASGADWESAARLANVAGGLEVEKFGCVPIPAEEVLAELRLESRMRGEKLRGVEELAAELALRRDRGETVVFTNGCFDILHAGHVDFLRRCRQEGSVLVVGLNSDASVRLQNKGGDRPIMAFAHRAALLSALEMVDYVVGFDDADPGVLIRRIRPDVLVKGEDWATKGVTGREVVEAGGGRVVLLPLVDGLSTTRIIERIRRGS